MAASLTLCYDREGDILHIEIGPKKESLVFDFLPNDFVVAYDHETGQVDHLDILGFSRHFAHLDDLLELPVQVTMTINPEAAQCD
jgi:hypothetical protein